MHACLQGARVQQHGRCLDTRAWRNVSWLISMRWGCAGAACCKCVASAKHADQCAAAPPQVVCSFCEKHLEANQAAFKDSRLKLIIDDARAQLEQTEDGSFDVIIGDLADPVYGGPCYQAQLHTLCLLNPGQCHEADQLRLTRSLLLRRRAVACSSTPRSFTRQS